MNLDDYAFLYTASEKGNNSGVRFMMTVQDAQRWCDSDLSRGQLHGVNWAYFWTSVRNFIDCYWGTRESSIDLRGVVDDGTWDERIAAAGCSKLSVFEAKDILGRLGIEVLVAGMVKPPRQTKVATPRAVPSPEVNQMTLC